MPPCTPPFAMLALPDSDRLPVRRREQFELVRDDARRQVRLRAGPAAPCRSRAACRSRRGTRPAGSRPDSRDSAMRITPSFNCTPWSTSVADSPSPISDAGQIRLRDDAARSRVSARAARRADSSGRTGRRSCCSRRHVRVDVAGERRFVGDRQNAVAHRRACVCTLASITPMRLACACNVAFRRLPPVKSARAVMSVMPSDARPRADFDRDVAGAALESGCGRSPCAPSEKSQSPSNTRSVLTAAARARQFLADFQQCARPTRSSSVPADWMRPRSNANDFRSSTAPSADSRVAPSIDAVGRGAHGERRFEIHATACPCSEPRDRAVPVRAVAGVGELAVGG